MNLQFDFTVDKEKNTIYITREFAASLDLVWDAFTKPEILDQWTAPKPFIARTKEMDFREGGRWIYAMLPAGNVTHYSLVEFIRIQPRTSFSTRNSFCDENGNPLNDLYSLVDNYFTAQGDTTIVRVEKKFNKLEDLEMLIAMGFKEGFSMSLANLDEYFKTVTA